MWPKYDPSGRVKIELRDSVIVSNFICLMNSFSPHVSVHTHTHSHAHKTKERKLYRNFNNFNNIHRGFITFTGFFNF